MCRVKLLDLPVTVRSFVKVKDGHETIVINARLSYEMQKDCYAHEMKHIRDNDFELPDANTIEMNAHTSGKVQAQRRRCID